MVKIERFEDLEVWQNARLLCQKVEVLYSKGTFAKDFELKNQINASSGSVMDNIAEGFERDGKNEFINFLGYSKGSAGETKSQLYRALDRKHITEDEFLVCGDLATIIGKQLGNFIRYLNQSEHKGLKFKDRI